MEILDAEETELEVILLNGREAVLYINNAEKGSMGYHLCEEEMKRLAEVFGYNSQRGGGK